MTLWIRLLTWSRLPLSAGITVLWMFGKFELGLWLFALGLLTKALDTPLSVWKKCSIPADDEIYQLVSVIFIGTAVIGITAGLSNMAIHDELSWIIVMTPSVISILLMTTSTFIKPHSWFNEIRSGLISVTLLTSIASFAPLWLCFTCIGLIWFGEGYKVMNYADKSAKEIR